MKKTILHLYIFTILFCLFNTKGKAQEGTALNIAVNNGLVEMYNTTSLYNLSSGSVSFWFKINDLTNFAILFSTTNKGTAGVNNNEFYIRYRKDYFNLQIVGVNNGAVTLDALTATNSITDNNWHNLTVVADGSGAIEVYIDAALTSITAGICCGGSTNDFFFADAGTLNNMKIGGLERASNLTEGNFLMDDFRIWSTALTQCQVTEFLTNPSITHFPGLQLYYNFEMLENNSIGLAGANDLRDLTGNNYSGDVRIAGLTGTPTTAYFPTDNLSISGGQYIEVYNASPLYILSTGTISFWFKLPDVDISATLFSATNKGIAGVNNNELYIRYREDYQNIQLVGVVGGVVTLDAATPTNSIADNNWHSLALVSDGAGAIQVFLDGTSVTLTAGVCCGGTTNDFFFASAGTLNNMKIGALERGTNTPEGNFLMDDFRIWNSASACNLELYYEFNLLENLSAGNAGANDYKDETNNTYNGDFIDPNPTSTLAYTNADGVGIFPNPCTGGNFTLALPDGAYDLALYNAIGEIILDEKNIEDRYTFSDKKLSSGIYNLQITNNGVKSNIKIQIN